MIVNTNLVGADNVMRLRFMTYTYETDPHYHARLSFYFGIVQDIAGLHAACRHLSIPELQKQGKTWVILRTKMRIFRYTAWPEDLLVETWAQNPVGLHMPRGIRAYDEQHEMLFEAMTQWAVLDIEHGFRPVRPVDITDSLKIPANTDTLHHLEGNLPRRILYDSSGCSTIATYQPVIHLLDTDGNHHVNNISYVNWMLDSLPNTFRDAYKVSEIDVSWMRQTFLGENVTVFTGSTQADPFHEEKPALFHKIVRSEQDGGKTTVWEGSTIWERRFNLARKSKFSL
jgi:acyl-ACP thioesterase